MFSNKNGCARIKKLIKMLMDFFQIGCGHTVSNDLTSFFCISLLMFSNKNNCARIKKLVKKLIEFFQNFLNLTENLVDFDVTCSVISGTVLLSKGPTVLCTTDRATTN